MTKKIENITRRTPVRPAFRMLACVLTAALIGSLLGCEEKPAEREISQFDRPQNVALTCYREVGGAPVETLHLDCCRYSTTTLEESDCELTDPDQLKETKMLAFVTQTTLGEVAVVDLYAQEIIDQDVQIPFNSFVPVGGQPSDIAAAMDGANVYTANYETGDMSVIAVMDSFGPALKPAASIDIGGSGAKLVLARAPSIRDKFAFVTQPTLGRLTVVALDQAYCPDTVSPGCVLGHLRLDAGTGIDHEVEDPTPEGIWPWAIIASNFTSSIYVGGVKGDYIAEIDSEILVNQALALASPGPLGEEALVRRIPLDGYTTRALAIEPELERWIYAIEDESGGIIVVDLVTQELVDVNADNPMSDGNIIELPGKARSIALVRPHEQDDVGPYTFNGTFALVTTTKASIFVIDVDDLNAERRFPHSLRSEFKLYTDDGEPRQNVAEAPLVSVDGRQVEQGEESEYASFVEGDTDVDSLDGGLPDCDADGGVEFRPESSRGLRFRCDPHQSTNEEWRLTWQGRIGLSGAAVIDDSVDDLGDDGIPRIAVVDETKDFCKRGLLGKDQGGTFDGIPGFQGYEGDMLVVTTDPTPELLPDGSVADCSSFLGRHLVYQVDKIIDPSTIRITNELAVNPFMDPSAPPSPLPDTQCFGQAFGYDILAFNHWILEGSRSGRMYHGSFNGQCIPIDDDPEKEKLLEGRRHRVFHEVEFSNYFFKFTMREGDAISSGTTGEEEVEPDTDAELFPEIQMHFLTLGGFSPLKAEVGNNMTDIEVTPDWDLVIVDQTSKGLVVFDMLRGFRISGSYIN